MSAPAVGHGPGPPGPPGAHGHSGHMHSAAAAYSHQVHTHNQQVQHHNQQQQQQQQQQSHQQHQQTHYSQAQVSHSSSPSTGDKSRKKSAHWTDADTDVLISVLLQHRDTGRTADNGFKPEVWEAASVLLERDVHMGGHKTPDACKSRWQRLQRDYKFARELEQFPGFRWDANEHRLQAADASWDAAAQIMPDAKKHRKINLPCYNHLAILCPLDQRIRARPPKRLSSSSSTVGSESSGVPSLQLTPTNGTNPLATGLVGAPIPDRVMMNGHGQHHQTSGNNVHGQQHNGLQPSLLQDSVWPDGDDSVESVDASFTLPYGTQHTMLQAQTHQQAKRHPPFDTALLASGTTPLQHSPKRARTQRQPHHTPTPTPPQPTQSLFPPVQNHAVNANGQTTNHDMNQVTQTTPQTPSRNIQNVHQQMQPPSASQLRATPRQQYDRSPQYPVNDFTLPSVPLQPPYRAADPARDRSQRATNRLSASASMPSMNGNVSPQAPTAPQHHGHARAPSGVSLSTLSMGTEDPEPEVVKAGLSASQRRTEAVLRLEQEELSDDDILTLLQEFEDNIEGVDVYLALRNRRLRAQWLKNKVRSVRSRG